jgi:hypothetical protein
VQPDDISTARIFAQAVGFRPAEMARVAETGFKLTATEQRILNERNRLITSAKVAKRLETEEGDERLQELVEGPMRKFSEKHPSYAIETDELVSILEKDIESRKGARLGVRVTEKNARFTDPALAPLEERIERENKKSPR